MLNHCTLVGLDSTINPDRLPKYLKDAMYHSDQDNWAAAMSKEFLGFKDMKALAIVKPPKGARIMGHLPDGSTKRRTVSLLSTKYA